MIKKGILFLLILSLLPACSTAGKNSSGNVHPSNISESKPDKTVASSPAEPKEPPKNEAKPAASDTANEPKNLVKWDDFFDDDKQDKPSQKFSGLNGQKVTLDGFMGEILSIGKGWFLLIPRPGAECPFDNGNQSYWNSIMIVFVKDKDKLRYTQGALRLTGKLDVGAKKDESGYTTMFRLYDAEYTKK